MSVCKREREREYKFNYVNKILLLLLKNIKLMTINLLWT